MMTSAASLQVDALSLGFGGLKVLREVDAVFRPGEVTGLIGPNGAGKTSFFNCLTGLYRPQGGSIHFGSTTFDGLSPMQRARHGLARSFQHVALCPDLTALQNVMFGLARGGRSGWAGSLLGLPSARSEFADMQARAETALTQLGIADTAGLKPGALPPGTLRLIEIARAIVASPQILLLDEPAAGLNASETRELTRTLRQLVAPELVIVVVEHDMDLIMEICDRIYVLNFGQVVACGTPDEVRRDPEVVRIYLGSDEDDGS
jgi:branched-chain amino acid transport system ATP-binding protein